MRVPDAYRAQLFIGRLTAGLSDLEPALLALGCTDEAIEGTIADVASALAIDLDSMTLPVVALELAIAKELGLLSGEAGKQRYASFFERDSRWQERARAILVRYRFLDQLIDTYVASAATALMEAVRALVNDWEDIRLSLLKEPRESKLVSIGLLGDGDRHQGGRRPLCLRFDSGTTVVFKPVDFGTYRFLDSFIRALHLEPPNDCFLPRTASRKGYGWMEYVVRRDCREGAEVKAFFRRFGVLLAVGEAVNLVDGHSENVVASGSYPVIVDLETILHNHSIAATVPDVFDTLLIEKVPDDGKLTSALMAPPETRRDVFGAYATSDRTDDLSVSYGRPVLRQPSNLPTLKGCYATVFGYAEKLVAGYTRTYDLISGWLAQEGARLSCMNAAKACRPRVVVRSTAYYSQVLRRLEQPEGMLCRDAAETIVRASLAAPGRFWESEVCDLLRYDVPYFHHNPAECHLYHWTGSCEEENLFPASAIDSLRESWRKRSPIRRDKNVERIRETLHEAQHLAAD